MKYKITVFKSSAGTIADYADAKRYALTQFAVTNWNPATAQVWLHGDLATNQIVTGLAEGFHILRARPFLPRDGKSSVFNTFHQTFYYDAAPPAGAIAFPGANAQTLASVDYGCVVRADDTATEVEYSIIDSDPNNDDANTGFNNGNGMTNGVPAFAKATAVNQTFALNAGYPNLPREFRFTYLAVPTNGSATLTIRVREMTSASSSNRVTTLVRTVNCAAPAQTLQVAFPSSDGQIISLPQGGGYTVVTRFTDTLTPAVSNFTITIDGAIQDQTNANGQAAYVIQDQTTGDGKNELRYDWRGMAAGQHLIEVGYVGDGVALQASRIVRVTLTGVSDTDGDGLPDFWENQNGFSPTNATGVNGATGDPDSDGFTNIEEYLAGTDPQDGTSLLKIIDIGGAGRAIRWNSIPGRNYQVYATTNVSAAFQAVSSTITAFGTPSIFTNTRPVVTREFYRVRALP